MKLNALLGKTDHGASIWKQLISAYVGFFKTKQAAFRGEKKTYTAVDGTLDEPGKRGTTLIVTTVDEKFKYLTETLSPYVDGVLSIEATNASGTAKATLQVGDINFGELSSIELMRLKGLLEEIKPVYEEIPVRADNEIWVLSNNDDYTGRPGIFEGPQMDFVNKTTLKESYILTDPNVPTLRDSSKYQPVVSTKDTIMTLGTGTQQKFSGEWSHRDRALLLDRRSKLLEAVIVALKQCNEVEQVASNLQSTQLFGYLHGA